MANPELGGHVKIKRKAIRNMPSGRLVRRLAFMHNRFHTVSGLHGFDEPKRSLVNNGMIMVAIRGELSDRNVPVLHTSCRICGRKVENDEETSS